MCFEFVSFFLHAPIGNRMRFSTVKQSVSGKVMLVYLLFGRRLWGLYVNIKFSLPFQSVQGEGVGGSDITE